MRLWAADAETGAARLIVEEQEKTWIESPVPPRVIPSRQQVLWWSQRSGWGHLYIYDLESGKLLRPLTSGDWVVRAILHADESNAIIAASGKENGREPYLRHLYRVNLETGATTLITPEDSDHEVAASDANAHDRFSPTGAYFVDVYRAWIRYRSRRCAAAMARSFACWNAPMPRPIPSWDIGRRSRSACWRVTARPRSMAC